MDLETALSKSAQLHLCDGILRGALLRRRAELRKSWRRFISSECLESLGSLAKGIESFLSGQDAFRDWQFAATVTWVDCDASFLDSLCMIALGGRLEHRPLDRGPA